MEFGEPDKKILCLWRFLEKSSELNGVREWKIYGFPDLPDKITVLSKFHTNFKFFSGQ